MKILPKYTQFFFILIISFLALAFSFLFSSKDIFQSILLSFCLFFLFPLLFIRFILKKSLREFGFSSHISRYDIFWFFSFFLLASCVVFVHIFFQNQKEVLWATIFSQESFWLFFSLFFSYNRIIYFFYEFF